MALRILFVEDDPSIALTVSKALTLAGYDIVTVGKVADAKRKLDEEAWDLLLLDVNLPDGTGYEVCDYSMKAYYQPPVLMLTARADEESVLRGLSGGAVDYMRKPVGPKEICLRIKKALGQKERITFGSLGMESAKRAATVNGKEIELQKREYEILELLAKRPEEVLPREEILQKIKADEDLSDRGLDSHVSRLRKKLRAAGAKDLEITAVYGVGYSLKKAA